ncbi:MAG: hypothetical protein KBB86_02935 [Candidatus Pacebacteria bacterium]|nr:hypothetical protein [Candidatus Paceibacterota bacterium]
MSRLRVAQESILDKGYFPWFIENESLQVGINTLMNAWVNYCKHYDVTSKQSHWPTIDGKKIGYRCKFDAQGNLKKESLLLSLSYLDTMPARFEESLGLSTTKVIEKLIHDLFKYCICESAKVLNMGVLNPNDIDICKEVIDNKHRAVLHLSHYLPNGNELFSDPHLYKGYATYLLAESGDNIQMLFKGSPSLIGLNPGQILVIPGVELKKHRPDIPAVKHQILASDKGLYVVKLFPL